MRLKSRDYWELRKAELMHTQIERADITFEEISKVYDESKKHIEKNVKGIFNKFSLEYGLTKKEAEQVVNLMRSKKSRNLVPALNLAPMSERVQRVLNDLNSPAYVSRINRLQKLIDEIDNVQRYIAKHEISKTTDLYKDVAKHGYYNNIHQMQIQTGIGFSFNVLDEDLVERLIKTPWNGRNYSERIWNNTRKLSETLKDEVLQAVLTGKKEKDVTDGLINRFNVGEFESKRLIRTETAHINNEMEALSYEEADIEKYRFVAVLDTRTSHICREHDYKVYKVSERQVGVNYPPLHPFCRSTTIAVFDDEDLTELSRRARDPKTGKTTTIPGDMDYEDWYDKYVVKAEKKVYNQGVEESEAEFLSKRIIDKISRVEPKITKDMQRIAGNNTLAGLEFRKKTADSLTRKIITDSQTENISLAEAASKINDALRYTTILNVDTFAKDYLSMKQRLIKEGFEIVKVKNTWLTDGPYKGVNTVLKKYGINFEMQYHTQESFDLKNGPLHELYEKRRLPSTTKAEKYKLDNEMLELSKSLKVPKNIERVKEHGNKIFSHKNRKSSICAL